MLNAGKHPPIVRNDLLKSLQSSEEPPPMKINMIGLTFMAIHLRQGHYQTYEFIHKRDMRYKIRDMQSGRNPLCQPGWIWCHESMCGMVGMWGGGVLYNAWKRVRRYLAAIVWGSLGWRLRGGVVQIQGPIRERELGVSFCPTSPDNLPIFSSNNLHALVCSCTCVYACIHMFSCMCVCVCAVPSYTCVRLWRHRHNQSLIGSTRCISEA